MKGELWLTGAMVLRGKLQQHRQWMTRSYAVALVFLEVRIITGLGGWDNSSTAGETIVWTCLIFAYPLADIGSPLAGLPPRQAGRRERAGSGSVGVVRLTEGLNVS